MAELIRHDGRLNPARVYLASLAAGGRTGVYYQLQALARILIGSSNIDDVPWHELDRATVIAIIEKMRRKGMAPNTINHSLSILKRVSEEAMSMGMMDMEAYTRISLVKRPKGSRQPPGHALTKQEVRRVVDRCLEEGSGKSLRDAAIISVGAGCGLRCDELSNLRTTSLEGDKLRFIGKGNKEALQPVSPQVRGVVSELVDLLPPTDSPLFPRWRRYDCAGREPLTESGIYYVLRGRLGRGTTPHDLRRTYATWLDQDGHPLSVIQRLMRHSSPETTMRYIRNSAQVDQVGESLEF